MVWSIVVGVLLLVLTLRRPLGRLIDRISFVQLSRRGLVVETHSEEYLLRRHEAELTRQGLTVRDCSRRR